MKPFPGMNLELSPKEALFLQASEDWQSEEGKPEVEEAQRTPLIFYGAYYAQVPIGLLRDPELSPAAKCLYAVYHSFCSHKDLRLIPFTFVSQKRIAKEWMMCSRQTICNLTKQLKSAGWLTSIRQGQGYTNIIILHDLKGKRISGVQKRAFKCIVKTSYKTRSRE